MSIKKQILLLVVLSLTMAFPVFSGEEKSNCTDKLNGKVKVSYNNSTPMWLEFKATDNQAIKGTLRCWNEDKSKELQANIIYMEVDGEYAWLAGKCTKDSEGLTGGWFFMTVHDGGTPGKLVDQVWMDWLPNTPNAESIAKAKVENLERPKSNKPIAAGDITVVPCNK